MKTEMVLYTPISTFDPTLLLTGDYGKRDTPFVLGPPGLAIEK